jgi:formate hydrogenlyase subunit 3/multisubunit Na+/H+ antiporter MnhD subunit
VTTRQSPQRSWPLVVMLALVALLATAFVVIAVAGSQLTTDLDGATREVGLAERLSDNPARFLLPLGLALAAGGAGLGLVGSRPWAPSVAVGVGVATLLIGMFLLYQAAREWGMEGSFSPLLVPPGVVCLGVGAYIVLAARHARRILATRA